MRWAGKGRSKWLPRSGLMWAARTWGKAPARSNQRAYALRKEDGY